MKRLALAGLLLATGAGAVFIVDPEMPESEPEPQAEPQVRYDADCFDVVVYVNGQQVLTKSRGPSQFCADRVILLSECPIFADAFEAPPTL